MGEIGEGGIFLSVLLKSFIIIDDARFQMIKNYKNINIT